MRPYLLEAVSTNGTNSPEWVDERRPGYLINSRAFSAK